MKTEWVHKKLGDDDVAKIIMGQSPSSTSYNDENVGLPFLQGCADFGEVFPMTSVYCDEPLKVAPQNSILMSVRAPVGTINKADQQYIIGRGLCSIVPQINNDYLYYYLLQNKNRFEQKAQGSTFLAINSAEVNDFDVSYPNSLPAQRRIAAILSSADKVIAATQKTIAKYKKIKQGMMEELLKPKEGWKMVKLGECLTIGNGQDYKHLHNGDIPVYGTGGVMTYVDDYLYDGETVCIGRKGTINKPIFHVGKIWTVDTLFYTHSFIDVTPLFIYYVFCNTDWDKYNEATGVPSLSKDTIYKIEIPVPFKENKPDLTEQYRIASILSGIDAKIAAEEKVLEKYEKVKKGLMERMMEEENK